MDFAVSGAKEAGVLSSLYSSGFVILNVLLKDTFLDQNISFNSETFLERIIIIILLTQTLFLGE